MRVWTTLVNSLGTESLIPPLPFILLQEEEGYELFNQIGPCEGWLPQRVMTVDKLKKLQNQIINSIKTHYEARTLRQASMNFFDERIGKYGKIVYIDE